MDYHFLESTLLFQGIPAEKIPELLTCLHAEQKSYAKGSVLYHAGETTQYAGLVLSGSVCIENHDFWGNTSILDQIGPGQLFAETYACVPDEPLMVTVVAAEASLVLFLNIAKLFQSGERGCLFQSRLIQNLLTISAEKNLTLSRRMFHISPKSIRGRLLSYLSFEAVRRQSCEFTIPFNRQQLADYLGVDRSALSNELGKMQREGLLQVTRSHFLLNENAAWEGFLS